MTLVLSTFSKGVQSNLSSPLASVAWGLSLLDGSPARLGSQKWTVTHHLWALTAGPCLLSLPELSTDTIGAQIFRKWLSLRLMYSLIQI